MFLGLKIEKIIENFDQTAAIYFPIESIDKKVENSMIHLFTITAFHYLKDLLWTIITVEKKRTLWIASPKNKNLGLKMKSGASRIVTELTRRWKLEKNHSLNNTITLVKEKAFTTSYRLITTIATYIQIKNIKISMSFSSQTKREKIELTGHSKNVFRLIQKIAELDPNIASKLGAGAAKGALFHLLPVEVCAMIGKLLDIRSAMQFSITCKNAHLFSKDAVAFKKRVVFSS